MNAAWLDLRTHACRRSVTPHRPFVLVSSLYRHTTDVDAWLCFCCSDFKKLELLQELNISGNQLRSLPAVLGTLSKLVILRAHSNVLQTLPDFRSAASLRVSRAKCHLPAGQLASRS